MSCGWSPGGSPRYGVDLIVSRFWISWERRGPSRKDLLGKAEPPPAPPRAYHLTTKQGTTTFQTGEEWLAAWAKLVRGCKAAKALDKLQTARQTNHAHIAAVAAFDPEPAATLSAELDHALSVSREAP
jgi:hypothetical protein